MAGPSYGPLSSRPAASTAGDTTLYFATDYLGGTFFQVQNISGTLTWVQVGQGAQVQDKGGEVFDVNAYGASPFASAATNQSAFQAALDACSALDGGIVFVPPGTYNLTSTLTIPNCIALVGSGFSYNFNIPATVLSFPAGVGGIFISTTANGASVRDLGLSSGSWNGTTLSSPGTDVGIEIHAGYISVERVTVAHFGSHGLMVNNLLNEVSADSKFTQVHSLQNHGNGFHVTSALTPPWLNANVLLFDKCVSDDNNGIGYFQDAGLLNTIVAMHLEANQGNYTWPVEAITVVDASTGGLPKVTISTLQAEIGGTPQALHSPVTGLAVTDNATSYLDWNGNDGPSSFTVTTSLTPTAGTVRVAAVTASSGRVNSILQATTSSTMGTVHGAAIWIANDLHPGGALSSTTIVYPYIEAVNAYDVVLKHGGGTYHAPAGAAGNLICAQPQQWDIVYTPSTPTGQYTTRQTGAFAAKGQGVSGIPAIRSGTGTFGGGGLPDFQGRSEFGVNLSSAQTWDGYDLQVNGTYRFRAQNTGEVDAVMLGLYGPTTPTNVNATPTGRLVGCTSGGAPTTGTWSAGDIVFDKSLYTLWFCVTGGTPGVWARIAVTFHGHEAPGTAIDNIPAPLGATSTIAAQASGTIILSYFTVEVPTTVSYLDVITSTQAASGQTLLRAGLYTIDASNNGTLVFASADVHGSYLTATNTEYSIPLTLAGNLSTPLSSYQCVPNQLYAGAIIGVLGTGLTSQPNWLGVPGNATRLFGSNGRPRVSATRTGQSDLANFTNAQLGSLGGVVSMGFH